MIKKFKFYLIVWVVMFLTFNLVTFLSPNELAGYSKFGGAFIPGYIAIFIAFIGQLLCSFFAFSAKTKDRFFLNVPSISYSYTALIITVIVGTITMAVPNLPIMIGTVICLLVLGFSVASVIKATATADIVDKRHEQVKQQTSFIKASVAQAQSIAGRASDSEIKAQCNKVYEALRYSDPMSTPELQQIEQEIYNKMNALNEAVNYNNTEMTNLVCKDLLNLIATRSNKCKLYK